MKERILIQKSKEQINMKEFIRHFFTQAKISDIEVQHTPIVTRIVIYTTTPGLVIGSGGERINELVDALKKQFKIDNPQIDVQKIANEDLDPNIVAQSIAASLESGVNYKKLGNFYIHRVMNAGAIGCELIMSGKLSGERSRKERFVAGYLKKCGEPAKKDVLKGFATAKPRLGDIGVTVMVMLHQREDLAKKVALHVAATQALAAEQQEKQLQEEQLQKGQLQDEQVQQQPEQGQR
ncbi:MAG: 30S ribosomal protein S3 [Candidatus Aenigmarchaeota archaeon]|nr:30S ribosomal protein S3 [Candidatus Aenigmarchaeota archaeon]